MTNQEKKEMIKKRILELKEWEKDLPAPHNFLELITKFEDSFKELE